MHKLRIAIVGYGIAGISAAVFLRRLGHEVIHLEGSATPADGGAGLLLNATGLEVLERLGLRRAAMALGAVVSRVYGETSSGARVMDLRYGDHGRGNLGLGIQRRALIALLRAADADSPGLQTSRPIVSVDAEHGYVVDDKARRVGPFDLIVAADGARSRIRNGLVHLVLRDRPYRSGAVVCLLDDAAGIGQDRLLQVFAGPRHVSIWPVGAHAAGATRRVNVSVNVPVEGIAHLRDTRAWRRHVVDLYPPIVPVLRETSSSPELLAFTYRDVVLRRYYDHRVVFIGDAAHCMSPQLGQGASMGIQDSWVLAMALQAHASVPAALAAFDRQRRIPVSAHQRLSRWTTPVFQSESRTLALLRDRVFYRLSQVPFVNDSVLRTLSGR